MQFLYATDDEVLGVSVNIRKNDDLIQVWNKSSSNVDNSQIVNKIKSLLPGVEFETNFYKGFFFNTIETKS